MEMSAGRMTAVIVTRQDIGKNCMPKLSINVCREVDMKTIEETGACDVAFTEASDAGREATNRFDCTEHKE